MDSDPPPPQPDSPPDPPPTPPSVVLLSGVPTAEERQWAMFCHLSGLVGHVLVGFGHVVVPLVLWLIKREQMPFVNQEGKEAVNFQISISIYFIVSGLMTFACVGFVMLCAVSIVIVLSRILRCDMLRAWKAQLLQLRQC